MAHNVPAICDVLPARIRACVARPGLAKCGWREAWERSQPRRLEPPGAPERARNALLYDVAAFHIISLPNN
jgi:hypothetical protein